MQKIEDIKNKASYCLGCKIKPCSNKGCPLNNNIPEFIRAIKSENYNEAYKILSQTTVLPGVCGRICPHQKQCEGSCVRGIKGEPVNIGDLEAFVFDFAMQNGFSLLDCYKEEIEKNKKNKSKKVAIIGGGPAGLTCAAFLAKNGISVTIYEKYNYLGGLLVHGIPEFRLPKEIVQKTIDMVIELGVKVKYNMELNKNLKMQELKNKFDAIYLAFGANVSSKMGVQGEELDEIYGGNELLEYNLHPNYKGKTVAVIGGGNVAMDCARTIKRLGAKEVKIVYRRSKEQMPAEEKEVNDAQKEGIDFLFQNNVVKITKNRNLKLELIKTKLIQKDGELRKVPINIDGSNYIIDVDYVVMALGSRPEEFVSSLGLVLNNYGNILVDENYMTSDSQIYAGGDLAGIKGTVAWAAKSGREAAICISKNLRS